jgi:hypothetical protein
VCRDSLWYKVLVARYGLLERRFKNGGRVGSMWSRHLCSVRDGEGLVESWSFDDNLVQEVG